MNLLERNGNHQAPRHYTYERRDYLITPVRQQNYRSDLQKRSHCIERKLFVGRVPGQIVHSRPP